MNKIYIAHIFPELLNCSGDFGNLKAIIRHLEDAGFTPEINIISPNDNFELSKYNLIYISGSFDYDRSDLMPALNKIRPELEKAITNQKTILAIDNGLVLLGKYYEDLNGRRKDCLNLLDFYAIQNKDREANNYLFSINNIKVAGFENHSEKIYLGEKLKPLGKILVGHGNNGEDQTEGVRYQNLFGTFAGGPVLPKNPEFCELILKTMLGDQAEKLHFKALKTEINAHNYLENRIIVHKNMSNNF